MKPSTVAPPLQGIVLLVLAVLCFASLDTTTQFVAGAAPVVMLVWVRFLLQTLSAAALFGPGRGRALLHTRRPGLQLLRGLLLVLCAVTAFFSLRILPVGEFTAVVMITPLVITLLAAWRLHERVSWLRWACVLGGFAGSLVVIHPGSEMFHWTLLLPLLLVAANTGYQLLTSRLGQTEDSATTHFYSGLVGLVLATLALPVAWQSLSWTVWGLLLLIAAFSTVGHFLLILAYGRASVSSLTPFLYAQIGFAAAAGWLVFSHVPDSLALAGIALVAVSGVVGTWLSGRDAKASAARQSTLALSRPSAAGGPSRDLAALCCTAPR